MMMNQTKYLLFLVLILGSDAFSSNSLAFQGLSRSSLGSRSNVNRKWNTLIGGQQQQLSSRLPMVMDPASLSSTISASSAVIDSVVATSNSWLTSTSPSTLLSFVDQGANLAGIFFQASLLPYLLFLYFLSFPANRLSELANLGFQYVLIFVVSTIPSGILSKSVYGTTLANVDWLHGGAETLLTVANIFIVVGLNQALRASPEPASQKQNQIDIPEISMTLNQGRIGALATAGAFAAACFLGITLLNLPTHAPFLFGLGGLPSEWLSAGWMSHSEPSNALSIPTWFIHFSSVFEYLVAMNLVWRYADATDNQAWKGLTWGMLPLHASGICACTYHFFYNPSSLQFLVTMQAALTLVGNITCGYAAYRIARSNGWNLEEIFPFTKSPTSPYGLVTEGLASMPLQQVPATRDNNSIALLAKLVALSLFASYLVKYGELGLDLPFEANPAIALAMIVGFPSITAARFYRLSSEGDSQAEAKAE